MGFCAVCVYTDTASAVGGWGTNYTKILPDFNTGPVFPCNICSLAREILDSRCTHAQYFSSHPYWRALLPPHFTGT